jgi:hypothetical protein
MDFEIKNLAPDADVVYMVFGDHADSQITVTIDRDETGQVNVLVIDHMDGSERRMVLGQPG